jgi:hypothetical protein
MCFFWFILLGLCICSSTRSNVRTDKLRRSARNAYRERPVVAEKKEAIPSILTAQIPARDSSPVTAVATVPRNYNFLESEAEAVQALSMLYESSKGSKANYPPPRRLNQSNYRTKTHPSVETVQSRTRSQTKTKAILHPAPLVEDRSASAGIPDSEIILSPSLIQHNPSHEAKSENSAKRSLWFSMNGRAKLHSSSQTAERGKDRLASFSQYHCRGNILHRNHGDYMSGKNVCMGYRIAQDRLVLLDGYKLKVSQSQQSSRMEWLRWPLNEEALKIREFSRYFPLKTDGLVVAFSDEHQLMIASYGKPPLGAIILHPDEDYLVFVARSSDNTIESINVQDGDIVVIGTLERISQLESGQLKLDTSDSIEEIAKKVYGSDLNKSLCIVAAIEAG